MTDITKLVPPAALYITTVHPCAELILLEQTAVVKMNCSWQMHCHSFIIYLFYPHFQPNLPKYHFAIDLKGVLSS